MMKQKIELDLKNFGSELFWSEVVLVNVVIGTLVFILRFRLKIFVFKL